MTCCQTFASRRRNDSARAKLRIWSSGCPSRLRSLPGMTAREAGGTAGPQAPQGPSFIRRHPILAAFGVLAALSLFAAYWPVSAIVTGVLVGARASGADRVAYRWLSRGAAAVAHRFRRAPTSPADPPGGRAPEPPAPSSSPVPSPRQGAPSPVTRAPDRSRPEPGRAAAGITDRELGGP